MAKKSPSKKAAAKKKTSKAAKAKSTTEKPLMPTVTDRAKFFKGQAEYREYQLRRTQEQMAKKAK